MNQMFIYNMVRTSPNEVIDNMHKTAKEIRCNFGRGIALLFIFILLGIFMVETQLNELTLEDDFAKVLNLRREQKTEDYTFYLLGDQINIGHWAIPEVKIEQDKVVIVFGSERQVVVPLKDLRDNMTKWTEGSLQQAEEYYQVTSRNASDLRENTEKYFKAISKDLNYYF